MSEAAALQFCFGPQREAAPTGSTQTHVLTAGALTPADVFAPVLEQLRGMAAVFRRQAGYHFFSASVLMLYEGAAQTAGEARASVRLIDFAHAFPAAAHGGAGPDTNFLGGLTGLIAAIEEVVAGGGPRCN
jgi:hypothetical protein